MRDQVMIIGHRGAAHYEKENTLASFEKAIALGVDGIELDVRITRDGKVAVIHDAKVNRTTNKKGYVKDYSLEELGRMGVPSLQNVIDLIKGTKIVLFVEIKDEGMEERFRSGRAGWDVSPFGRSRRGSRSRSGIAPGR